MLTRTKYSGRRPLVVGAAVIAAVLMALLPLAGCDTNSGSGGTTTTTQQSGTGTGGTGGNTGTSGGGTSTGGTSSGGTGDNVGTGQNPPAAPTYTVTFNANGGTGTMAPQTFTAGTEQKLAANAFSNGELGFNGWNTKQDGTGTKYANLATFTATEDTTLYAQWATAYVSVTAGGATIRYADLESALAAANAASGSTLTLLVDIPQVPSSIPVTGSFTLDLAGHRLSLGEHYLVVYSGGSLTVSDSSQGPGGVITSSGSSSNTIAGNLGSSITISGGTVESTTNNGIMSTGIVTISGGTISGTGYGVGQGDTSGTVRLSGSPVITGGTAGFRLGSPVVLTGPLTGGSYTLDLVNLAGTVVAKGEGHTIQDSDLEKFSVTVYTAGYACFLERNGDNNTIEGRAIPAS